MRFPKWNTPGNQVVRKVRGHELPAHHRPAAIGVDCQGIDQTRSSPAAAAPACRPLRRPAVYPPADLYRKPRASLSAWSAVPASRPIRNPLLAARQLQRIGVLLLRHQAGTGGIFVGQDDEAEFAGGIEHQRFGQAAEVHPQQGCPEEELGGEIAVAETPSRLLGVGASKPRSLARAKRSIGKLVPASAPLPNGRLRAER